MPLVDRAADPSLPDDRKVALLTAALEAKSALELPSCAFSLAPTNSTHLPSLFAAILLDHSALESLTPVGTSRAQLINFFANFFWSLAGKQ